MLATMSLRTALFFGVAGAALASGSAARAQTEPPLDATSPQTSEAAEEAGADDIVVTGSRIVRDGFEAPTPITVLTQEDIQNTSPTNNVADFVNQLPSLAGSTRPSNSRLNLSSGQAGINALNLRNLGEVRTLVLLDGRRSVASTVTSLVDVNTLPQMLIERVEVVTGGASAAYGSDAVAGVVNFILDKDYEGIKLQADSGITSRGDGFNYSFGAAGGLSFADGRGHALLSGELAHRDGIFNARRGWNQTGFVRIQDPAWVSNATTPRFLVRRMVGAANSTPGGLITASTGGMANRLRGLYFGAGGAINQFQFGALTFPSPTGAAAPTLTQGGDWRINDSGRRIGLDPEDDRYGVFGRLSYEISDGIELFAEAGYNRQRIFFNAGPNLSTGQVLQANNAFLINAFNAAGRSLAGINTVTFATTAADLPFRVADNRRRVQRYTIGAQGDFELFGKPAVWDAYGQYGRAKLREQLRNIMHVDRLANATAAVFSTPGDTSSPIVCAINADASPTNNDPNCVPLNRLGLGVANPAAIDYVLGDPFRDEKVEQTVVAANLSMTPFATWAGDVSVALGAEYREEKIKGFVPQEFQPVFSTNAAGQLVSRNVWSVGNFLPTNGKYDVKEAYLEAVVPLGFGFEFNGAARATDYSTSGYVTTWKAGATWQPIDDFRLRATRSRDIRAPNLNELFQAGTANTDSVTNPFFPGVGPLGNTYGASISYSGLVTGNLDLDPEKADSWNIGAVVSPRFLPGFRASVDYFDIDLKDAIDSLTFQQIVNRCFEGIQEYCDAITQDPVNATRVLIRSQPFNFARRQVRGIDFDASYRTSLDRFFGDADGDISLRGVATRYIENRVDTGVPGAPVLNTVGVNGGQSTTPKWLYRFNATYDADAWSLTGVARGVSAGKYLANQIECTTNCPTGRTATEESQFPTTDDNTVSGAFYVDLNLTMKFDAMRRGDGEFFINVTNVFDSDPIVLPETGLAANTTYSDLLGRAFRVGVRLELD